MKAAKETGENNGQRKSRDARPRRQSVPARKSRAMSESSRRPALSGEKLGMPALAFDLDGTLVDSVYEQVAAWRCVKKRRDPGAELEDSSPCWHEWRILPSQVLREIRPRHRNISIDHLEKKHDINFGKSIRRIEILPGSEQLLRHLAKVRVQRAIATTGNKRHTARLLKKLDLLRTFL